ncbi:MAG: hypothetical protein WD066_16880 [Planctomycetaceae bacterium]
MNPANESSAAAFESGLFRTLFSFHMETINLLRNAQLDDRQRSAASVQNLDRSLRTYQDGLGPTTTS